MTPLLRVSNLVAGYGELRVLRGLSFELYPDEILAVVGANGVGKSTLLNAIIGQVRIWSGTVEVAGTRVSGRGAHAIIASGVALVPEGRRVFANLTVAENLLLGAHTRRDKKQVAADVDHWLESFPALRALEHRAAGLLSGGEQQMLALSRALMSRPKVLLLDEPSLGLAPKVITSVFEFITRVRDEGTAVVLVEQNARLALQRADRAMVMQRGEVRIEGPAAELANDPRVRDIYLGRTGAVT
jgi:branched-chain amino acid transport system ATP-binding protein